MSKHLPSLGIFVPYAMACASLLSGSFSARSISWARLEQTIQCSMNSIKRDNTFVHKLKTEKAPIYGTKRLPPPSPNTHTHTQTHTHTHTHTYIHTHTHTHTHIQTHTHTHIHTHTHTHAHAHTYTHTPKTNTIVSQNTEEKKREVKQERGHAKKI